MTSDFAIFIYQDRLEKFRAVLQASGTYTYLLLSIFPALQHAPAASCVVRERCAVELSLNSPQSCMVLTSSCHDQQNPGIELEFMTTADSQKLPIPPTKNLQTERKLGVLGCVTHALKRRIFAWLSSFLHIKTGAGSDPWVVYHCPVGAKTEIGETCRSVAPRSIAPWSLMSCR